ncbi:MAG: peptidylprolyl isomerase [Bacteroidota bacterium]
MSKLAPLFLLLILVMTACQPGNEDNLDPKLAENLPEGLFAYFQTNQGGIVARLEYERAPMTVANFVGLAEGSIDNAIKGSGEPYYDDITFHRVVNDFMIQGGDPNTLPTGTPSEIGRGGPGYAFRDEIHPELIHNVAGTLSMANMGPATNGSQFFITHKATPWLDGRHAVFGYVIRGLETVYKIGQNDTIQAIRILRQGAAAEEFDAPATFAELK